MLIFNRQSASLRTIRNLSTGLGLCALLLACSSNDSNPSDNDGAEDIAPVSTEINDLVWASCGVSAASFECSSLSVPMDYGQPDEAQIDISLIRSRATGPNRLGSLFVNLGGASGPGVEDAQVVVAEGLLPASIREVYDIVGFDPRGAGGSTPVDCSDVADHDFKKYPVDAAQVQQIHEDYSMFSMACSAKYGDYLQQLGSMNIVRDLDRIRIALGDDKVNFLAYSFATRVAALYLQEFPESSGRMILDGGVGPESSLLSIVSEPLALKEASLVSFFEKCRLTMPDCDPAALLTALRDRLGTLAASSAEVDQAEFEILFELLGEFVEFTEEAELFLPAIIEYLDTLDGSILQEIFTTINGPDEDPEVTDEEINEGDDGETVSTALLCADDADRPSVESLLSTLDMFNPISDIFAEDSIAELARCAGWPQALSPLAPIVTNTAPMSIVIGGSNDAVAPIVLSEDLAIAIGAAFLRSDHPGHVSVFLGKSDCVDTVAEAYLLDGTLPAIQECNQ